MTPLVLPYNKDSNAGLFIVRDFVTFCYTGSQTYFTPVSYTHLEYGDRLEPGVELKIEHSITMEYDTPDLTPFTNSDVKELESLRKISAGTEQKIFDSLKEPLSKWERQAALTKLLDRAIQYLKMPEVEHTSNPVSYTHLRAGRAQRTAPAGCGEGHRRAGAGACQLCTCLLYTSRCV